MPTAILAIARFTVLEARRSHLPLVLAVVLVAAGALAVLAGSLALTAGAAQRTLIYAGTCRLVLVALVTLVVVLAISRECDGRRLDFTLSRPLSRRDWYLGRMAGFAAVAAFCAVAATAPLLVFGASPAALAWGASLAIELIVVGAASLATAVALTQPAAAVLAVGAFYLLSRSIGTLVLMSHGPLVDRGAWSSWLVEHGVAVLARILPALDRATDSAWLLDAGVAFSALPAVAVQGVIYLVLLVGVGLFDLARREF